MVPALRAVCDYCSTVYGPVYGVSCHRGGSDVNTRRHTGDIVTLCHTGDVVTRCHTEDIVTWCHTGDTVTRHHTGDSVTRRKRQHAASVSRGAAAGPARTARPDRRRVARITRCRVVNSELTRAFLTAHYLQSFSAALSTTHACVSTREMFKSRDRTGLEQRWGP